MGAREFGPVAGAAAAKIHPLGSGGNSASAWILRSAPATKSTHKRTQKMWLDSRTAPYPVQYTRTPCSGATARCVSFIHSFIQVTHSARTARTRTVRHEFLHARLRSRLLKSCVHSVRAPLPPPSSVVVADLFVASMSAWSRPSSSLWPWQTGSVRRSWTIRRCCARTLGWTGRKLLRGCVRCRARWMLVWFLRPRALLLPVSPLLLYCSWVRQLFRLQVLLPQVLRVHPWLEMWAPTRKPVCLVLVWKRAATQEPSTSFRRAAT